MFRDEEPLQNQRVRNAHCETCRLSQFGLCRAVTLVHPSFHLGNARREGRISPKGYLYQRGDRVNEVKIVREGWVACTEISNEGKRYISDFLMPGDFADLNLFGKRSVYNFEALTEVAYCAFDREQFLEIMRMEPAAFAVIMEIMADLWRVQQQRIFDVTRRNAKERILSFALELYDRSEARGIAHGGILPFPILQRHIAEATALTDVHVSRILKELDMAGLLKIEEKVLRLPNPGKVRRLFS